MKGFLLGYGEIGSGVYAILSRVHEITIRDIGKSLLGQPPLPCEVLLIAFPWSEDFIDSVRYWQRYTEAESTIIFSTVPIGTCNSLEAIHCPIEAKHPFIERDVLLNPVQYVGGFNQKGIAFLGEAGLKLHVLMNPDHTEFLKLRSTSIYGINIEFARYCGEVARKLGLNWGEVRDYDQNHNELVVKRGTPEHLRYILDPPKGNIGGHCVVPNARLLDEQFPFLFLKEIYREKE